MNQGLSENLDKQETESLFEYGLQLGSASIHKLEALKEACVRVGIEVDVNASPAESEINAQPYGFDETYRGAMNRAKNTQTKNPKTVKIGIENGIVPIGDKFVDLAVVVVLVPNSESFIGTSAGIDFPREVVEEARKRGFETTTAGDVMAETMGASKTDPHSTLTGDKISRKEILVEAITLVLSRALSTK